jgi:zinc transporter ZupT
MLQESWAIFLRVALAFGLAVLGGAISISLRVSHKRLCCLISLAAGTLLGVTLFSILPESYLALPLWQLALGLGSGYLVFAIISKYVFHVCPACAASHFDEATTHRFSEIATAMVFALAVHGALDGLALAAGHEAEMSGRLDASLLLAICIHKIPEGLALGALLLGAGYGRGMVLVWVASVEATTLLGGVLGLWILPGISVAWIDIILAHVGGGFIFLAVHAVFGELLKHSKKIVLASLFSGMLLIAALNIAERLL